MVSLKMHFKDLENNMVSEINNISKEDGIDDEKN